MEKLIVGMIFYISDGCLTSEEGYHMSQFHAATEVLMTELTPEVIQAYIDTGEPMYVISFQSFVHNGYFFSSLC